MRTKKRGSGQKSGSKKRGWKENGLEERKTSVAVERLELV